MSVGHHPGLAVKGFRVQTLGVKASSRLQASLHCLASLSARLDSAHARRTCSKYRTDKPQHGERAHIKAALPLP